MRKFLDHKEHKGDLRPEFEFLFLNFDFSSSPKKGIYRHQNDLYLRPAPKQSINMDTVAVPKNRIYSIDVLRGIVMVIMAIDHVRDFFHSDAFVHDPLDAETTTPILFFTRWITHFCAPIFVFLAGTSAYLIGLRKSNKELSSFLIKRGIWLILIEMIVITFGITFNPSYNSIILQVIWAIGISMLILGLLIALRLPYKVLLILGLIIVFGHNLLDYAEAERQGQVPFFWNLAHIGRFSAFSFAPGHVLLVIYGFLPWTGIMLLGYGAGKLFHPGVDPTKRKKLLISLGACIILLFVLLRMINIYGDPLIWSVKDSGLKTFFSFMNVNKYPPSLLYTCITIGPALIMLAVLENITNAFTRFMKIFGSVPFFYYVVHFYLIHFLCMIAFFLSGHGAEEIRSPDSVFLFRPNLFGFDLWVVYLVWIGVILLLYPL